MGQKKVTVGHVHVHRGGQTIFGAVSTPKGGEGDEGNQSAGSSKKLLPEVAPAVLAIALLRVSASLPKPDGFGMAERPRPSAVTRSCCRSNP